MTLALAVLACAVVLVAAAVRQGFSRMASAIEQVGQGLAGAHSAAFEQLKSHIESAARELGEKRVKIADLEVQVADLTAKLAAANAPTGTPDEDLAALDAELSLSIDPAPAPVNPHPVSA